MADWMRIWKILYRLGLVEYIHEALWLSCVVRVQAYFGVGPHVLTLAEWLKTLTVNWANQDLTWEQLESTDGQKNAQGLDK